MKSLLKILYFFLVLIILFLLSGVFLPKKTNITTSVVIDASPEIIFDEINNLKNWDNWIPWHLSDTTIVIQYGEQVSGVGAVYNWISENSGSGKICIIESNSPVKVVSDMDFGKQGLAKSTWTLSEQDNKTLVKWDFENNRLRYFERYFTVFFKKNMIKTFNTGLKKLKETSEELKYDRISVVKEVAVSQFYAISISDSSSVQEIGEKTSVLFAKLRTYLDSRKISPVNKPLTLYKHWENEGMKTFSCAIPVAEKTWSWQEYQFIQVDSCQAVTVTHWGRYGSDKPYKALTQYINDNNLIINGSPWEIYVSDPLTESDTSKWQTDIYFPVRLK